MIKGELFNMKEISDAEFKEFSDYVANINYHVYQELVGSVKEADNLYSRCCELLDKKKYIYRRDYDRRIIVVKLFDNPNILFGIKVNSDDLTILRYAKLSFEIDNDRYDDIMRLDGNIEGDIIICENDNAQWFHVDLAYPCDLYANLFMPMRMLESDIIEAELIYYYIKEILALSDNKDKKITDKNIKEDEELRIKEILRIFITTKLTSVSLIQRKFGVNYNVALKLMEKIEQKGYVGPEIQGRRDLLITDAEYEALYGESAFGLRY